MKTVQDKDGKIIEVPLNTPCHAGINGELPIMLDEVIDAAVFAEIAERKAAYEAAAPERARQAIVDGIDALERQITPRRVREAILGIDNGWLVAQEALIAAERVKLG